MLDPRFKNLRIISSFVGKEQGVALVEEYDKILVFYVGEMPWTFASFGEIRYELCWPIYFWTNCKH